MSLPLRNASIVDPVWPLGFVVVGWVAGLTGLAGRVATACGSRCSSPSSPCGACACRSTSSAATPGHGEDFRYVAMREKHGDRFWLISLVTVFATQGLLMFVVSLPLQFGSAIEGRATGWAVLLAVGAAVWLLGFVVRIGRRRPARRLQGRPRRPRARSWTRACGATPAIPTTSATPACGGASSSWPPAPVGWAWISVVGPIVMTTLLRRVSGVTLLEKSMVERRPGYEDYVRRTSPFIPRPPRAVHPSSSH